MKTENLNWSYLWKHWFFTLLLGPVISQIIALIALFQSKLMIGLLEFYPFALIMSLMFSIPTYIIYAFVYHYLAGKSLSILVKKVILIVLAITGIYITLIIIDGTIALQLVLSYSIASVFVGLLFNLDFENS
ncbi:MAG: hypothetical protein EOO44_01345 [Flavobacterium sp.]|nr:MAG: hypothetical protein EOO44_01345 [Flavobacterium sp.]